MYREYISMLRINWFYSLQAWLRYERSIENSFLLWNITSVRIDAFHRVQTGTGHYWQCDEGSSKIVSFSD